MNQLRRIQQNNSFLIGKYSKCFTSKAFNSNTDSGTDQQQNIIFGWEKFATELPKLVKQTNMTKLLLIRDGDAFAEQRGKYAEFVLQQTNLPTFTFSLDGDDGNTTATIDSVNLGYKFAKRVGADGVIAFGGGNAIDASRAIATMITNKGNAEDYIRKKKKIINPPVPHIIVPTVAGCGNEVSTEALIYDQDEEAKVSFTKSAITSNAIVIDPLLTVSVPLKPTIQGSLSSLGQCIESLLFNETNESIENISIQGIQATADALRLPLRDGKCNLKNAEFREKLSLCSLFSSIASSSTGFGAAHAISIGVSSLAVIPHLELCSTFLPLVLKRYESLIEENKGDEYFDSLKVKMDRILTVLCDRSGYQATTVSDWVLHVSRIFNLRKISEFGFDQGLIDFMVAKTVMRLENISSKKKDQAATPIFEKEDIDSIVQEVLDSSSNANKSAN